MLYTLILLLHVISFIILMGVGAYSLSRRRSQAAFYFGLTNFIFAAYVLAILLEIWSSDPADMIFWRKLVLLPAAFVLVPWVIMVMHYLGKPELLSRGRIAALMAIPAVTASMVLISLAGDGYNLLRYNFYIDRSGPFPVVLWTNGPWFWAMEAFQFIMLFASIYLMIRSLSRDRPLYNRQTMVIMLGILIPMAGDMLFSVFGITPIHGLNPAGFTPLVSSLLVAWGMFHYGIMDIVPIARNNIVDTMADPLLILDGSDRIVDFNTSMRDFLEGAIGQEDIGEQAASILTGPLLSYLTAPSAREKVCFSTGSQRRIFDLSIQPINDRAGRHLGRLVLLHDISAIEMAKDELEERASQAAIANEKLQKEIAERQAVEAALRISEKEYRAIFENTGTAMIIVDGGSIITLVNSKLEEMVGYSKDEVENKMSWMEFVSDDDIERMVSQHRLRKSGPDMALKSYEFRLKGRAGKIKDTLLTVGSIPEAGKYVASLIDITKRKQIEEELRRSREDLELKVKERTLELAMLNKMLMDEIVERQKAQEEIIAALKGKELLLREVHHRVKNNLQVISSLLYLQSKRGAGKDLEEILQDSQNRVKSMALVHEKLYKSENMGSIDLSDYANSLVGYLYHCYDVHRDRIDLKFNVEGIVVDVDTAIPVGLIVNEIVSNSLKHAFPDGRKGEIGIEIHIEAESCFRMTIWDDGVGFEGDFDNAGTLGLQLVNTLVKQIDGMMRIDSSQGTRVEIAFREQKYKERY